MYSYNVLHDRESYFQQYTVSWPLSEIEKLMKIIKQQ